MSVGGIKEVANSEATRAGASRAPGRSEGIVGESPWNEVGRSIEGWLAEG